jgi:hypothetical protein
MAQTRGTKRPQFLREAAMVDAGRLSQQHRRELIFSLPKRLQDDRAAAFLDDVSQELWNCENVYANEKPSVVRDAGLQVIAAARQLQTALAGITGNDEVLSIFDGQFTGHLHATDRDKFGADWNDPRIPWDEKTGDGFLQKLVTDLDLLRTVAGLVGVNANVDPHVKPSSSHGYEIARCTAIAWRKHFNEEPKANSREKSTAFTKFLAELATRARVNTSKPDLYPAVAPRPRAVIAAPNVDAAEEPTKSKRTYKPRTQGLQIGATIATKAIENTKPV